ncbi:hypothetical protein RND71_011498 [Anisodus tanguticus]|uniref:Response regulatory domain-containing protein n=1 Tax=Anisodus tanguticus TaxID=243964 RepID=A0AAE1VKY6_9SOLA|nr:hypothetical protein RND71_011498 [Anisodus tanguticus]
MAKEHSRLCCLIDHYLRPYTVYTETKRRVKEFESDDSFDMAGNSVGGGQIITESHAANHHCLTNVFEVLVRHGSDMLLMLFTVILMIRLSNQIHLDYSIVILWLDLIHTYFQDILLQPMDGQEFGVDKNLEGSPFWVMTFDMKKKWISSKHLQRLAIFLFFKCSSSLLNMKETTDQHYACKNLKSCSGFDLNPKLCSRRKALLELHEWLREHLPGDRFDHDMYSEKCMDFVSSFLQLYMQEDDILFGMLLQMFCLPFYSEKFTNEVALSDDELRQFSLISHLFHPIHFFHLFLAGVITTTRNANEAVEMLRKNKESFDIVITDVVGDDMDGFKLLEAIGLEMDIPIIMTSANDSQRSERQAGGLETDFEV